MPVLNKISHKKAKLPENLSPDDRVFYIPETQEVFRDYKAFFDRAMLYNTAAWSCSISGKIGFTFKEAMECESQSRHDVEAFQQSLKVPVLYLTTLIKRRNCSDLVEELVNYMKDRFFVNEEVIYTKNSEKLHATVKSVHCEQIRPTKPKPEVDADSDDEDDECLASIAAQNKNPSPSAYKYEITVKNDKEYSEVTSDCLSRKKNALSKEKLKLFLKAQCRVGSDGYWKVKSHLMALGLEDEDAISSFFSFPIPRFKPPTESRRKSKLSLSPKKKSKTSKSKKSSEKTEKKKSGPKPKSKEPQHPPRPLTKEELAELKRHELELKKLLKEQEHIRQAEVRKIEKERQKEERIRERQRQIEEKRRMLENLREYNKPRDDLLCDDLRPLPAAMPVKLRHVNAQLFSEIAYILEFCHIFYEFLEIDFAHFSIGNLELALTSSTNLDGVFYEILTNLLRTVFDLRKAEWEEVEDRDSWFIDPAELEQFESDILTGNIDYSLKSIQKMSKIFARQLNQRYGVDIEALPISTATITEILRLHIWSSSALRFHHASDEPAIDFCHFNPDVMQELAVKSVFELKPEKKLKIIRLLMDQLLVFVEFRDFIDESFDKIKEAKARYHDLQNDHAKWVKARDFSAVRERTKIKPTDPSDTGATEEEKKQKRDIKTAAQKLQKCISAFQQQEVEPFVEQTRRSSRRGTTVISSKSATETLLDDNEHFILECSHGVLAMLTDEECMVFDRWRSQIANKRVLVIDQELLEISDEILRLHRVCNLRPLGCDRVYRRYWAFSSISGLFVEDSGVELSSKLLVPVKQLPLKEEDNIGPIIPEKLPGSWGFYSRKEDLEKLITSLNSRGLRENVLKGVLTSQFKNLCDKIEHCPVDVLGFPPKLEDEELMEVSENVESSLHSLLREHLVELEEKLFSGSLGTLRIDRQEWKNLLENGKYTPVINEVKFGNNFVEPISQQGGEDDAPEQVSVRSLAIVLLLIEQGVDRKFVKNPLWPNNETAGKAKQRVKKLAENQDDENSKSSDFSESTVLAWEESVMRSTSLSQIFLHLAVLESSIMWSRSILKAHCRICKRKADPGSMLLCDGCNLGYHCYCLRPPLSDIPEGDWYCMECKPENFVSARASNRRAAARKPRRPRDELDEEEIDVPPPPRHSTRSLRRGKVVETEDELDDYEVAEVAENKSLSTRSEAESDEENGDGVTGDDENGESDSENDSDNGSEDGSGDSNGSENGSDDEEGDDSDRSEGGSNQSGSDNEDSNSADGSDNDSNLGSDNEDEFEFHSDGEAPKSKKPSRSSRVHVDADYATVTSQSDESRSSTPQCAECSANAADDMAFVRCDSCETVYHLDCVSPALSRKPRGGWNCPRCCQKSSRRSSAPITKNRSSISSQRDMYDYVSSGSSNSNQAWATARSDASTKKAEQVLADLIKHDDSWLFLKPVSKKQVPDYFDVIKKPMDFGTIRAKTKDSPYTDASDLLDDCQLVFDNCFTYNTKGDEYFNIGVKLFKFFLKRIRDIGLDSTWNHYKAANTKLTKYGGEQGAKRSSSNNGHSLPSKQSKNL